MKPRHLLRTEGAAVALAGIAAYLVVDGPLWLFVLLILAPDLSMVGYLDGPRSGARVYNVAHTYSLPLGLATVGFVGSIDLLVIVSLVWIVHIGVDRAFGYGFKYDSGFHDTHLSPTRSTTPSGEGPNGVELR